jgi:hypothetical protein
MPSVPDMNSEEELAPAQQDPERSSVNTKNTNGTPEHERKNMVGMCEGEREAAWR